MGALVESESLTDEPPAVGARFRDVFEDHGHRVELLAEVAAYEPDRRLEVRLRAHGFEATLTQTLGEEEGTTRLDTVIETEYTSLVARLAAGVVTRHAQRRLEADLEALRRLLEEEGRAAG